MLSIDNLGHLHKIERNNLEIEKNIRKQILLNLFLKVIYSTLWIK